MSKSEDGGAEQIDADVAGMCVAAQQDLIVDLFEVHNGLWSSIKIRKFDWAANAKQLVKWLELKAVEAFAFGCRWTGMISEHEFMKRLLELRPAEEQVEAVFEKEKRMADKERAEKAEATANEKVARRCRRLHLQWQKSDLFC